MFIHAPDDDATCIIPTMLLWNNPDLGLQAVRFLRHIESRSEAIHFQIRELSSKQIEQKHRGERFRQACSSPLLLLAFDMSLAPPTEAQKSWFQDWANNRSHSTGTLAVLNGLPHLEPEQFESLVHDHPQDATTLTREERAYHDFLRDLCRRTTDCEFVWGAGESDLQEAAQSLGYLPSNN